VSPVPERVCNRISDRHFTCTVTSLSFDGLTCLRKNSEQFAKELLEQASDFVHHVTDLRVSFLEKDMMSTKEDQMAWTGECNFEGGDEPPYDASPPSFSQSSIWWCSRRCVSRQRSKRRERK
jgi:hypothetical protein